MKKLVSILFMLMISQWQYAQKFQEVAVVVGGGLSTLQTSLVSGDVQSGFGMNVGLRYTYHFSPSWGILSGVEFSDYHSTFSLPALSGWDSGMDPLFSGEVYTLNYHYQLYEERTKIRICQIPLMLQYVFREKLIVSFGGKIAIPYKTSYSITAGSLETNGYFSYEDRTYQEVGYGLETFNDLSVAHTMKLNPACLLSLEAGRKWMLGRRVFMKTSVYVDYGLNDMRRHSDVPAVHYEPAGTEYLGFNSVLLTPETKDMRLWAIGVRIHLGFDLHH